MGDYGFPPYNESSNYNFSFYKEFFDEKVMDSYNCSIDARY